MIRPRVAMPFAVKGRVTCITVPILDLTVQTGRAMVAGDLSTGAGVEALAAAVMRAACGRLDVLVNNAAALVGGRATVDTPEELIDVVLDTNIKAPFLITPPLEPSLLDRGYRSVINNG